MQNMTLLHIAQYINRHTSWLNCLKKKLALDKFATSILAKTPTKEEIQDIINHANTSTLASQLRRLEQAELTHPDIYILGAECMGDVIAMEPIGRYVRASVPDGKIHWIIRDCFADIFKYTPFIDQVIPVRSLSEGYDLLSKESGNPHSITINCHMDGTGCAVTKRIIRNPINPQINFFSYYNIGPLLNAFSLAAGLPLLEEDPIFHLSPNEHSTIHLDKPYIVIQCHSNDKNRDWSDDKWKELVTQLMDTGYHVVEVGMPRTIQTDNPLYHDFTGRKNLQQVAHLIHGAALFIGIDSGFAHFAYALQTPSVILLGKYAHYNFYMPYSGSFANSDQFIICRAPEHKPASEIPEETILQTTHRVLCSCRLPKT